MKYPFLIENFGAKRPNIIIVYNWGYINKVDNAMFQNIPPYIPHQQNCVAIFKIKWKCDKST